MKIERGGIEELAIERLRSKFPGKSSSWVRRALRRFKSGSVRQINESTWVVSGDPRLGDEYPSYVVRFRMVGIIAHASRPVGGMRRKSEICTHIAAVILHREYSKLLQPIYAAVINMECHGDYHMEVMDKEVKVIKQVKAMSSGILKPRYKLTYVVVSESPKTVKVRYACGDEVDEQEVTLSKTMRFIVELFRNS
ncbi:hypothetical protein [Vulcanisaeta distributa]|uniref:hypothetical protein n=1 Tax=Vulcanisaeta distributa TaxID=164451 RepID=UPI000AC602AF|nr:hypothetical protein [Vulcanisaeta distributa]